MLALTAGSPSLPIFVVLPVMMLYLVLIGAIALKSSGSTAFLVIAFAARLAMSAQPHFSYSPSPLHLSWNALVSLILIGIGILILHRSRAVPLILVPLAPLSIVVIASMILNKDAGGAVESLVKYAYIALLALTAYDAFVADGPGKVLTRLVCTFILPLTLQFASIALHIDKATESDGSASYIGGYNHEASFSIILLTGLLTAALNPSLRPRYKMGIAALCVVGIVAANYRTAIISAGPLLIGVVLSSIILAVPHRQRSVAAILAVLAVLAVVPVVPKLAGDRFDTLETIKQNPDVLLKSPEEFSKDDRAIMSGRLYLWSQYIDQWRHGTHHQHVVGYGANAWEGRYRYYAHNTLVSSLYELGTAGVAAMLLLWLWMFSMAVTAPSPMRPMLILAHLGFFILNMATMPFWMIEGLLFYGLLCGCTVFERLHGSLSKRRPVVRAAPPRMALPS